MPLVDLNKPGEKKKLIWASVLGLIAIIFLWWTFVGFGSSSRATTVRPAVASATPTPRPAGDQNNATRNGRASSEILAESIRPISYERPSYDAPEAKRNIFAYYVPPVKTAPPPKAEEPSPTPPPPVLLASISPANAYARAPEFTLEVAGDKFTPETRIFVDGRELPTKYISPQQLSTTVPATFIANPGPRPVMVRTPDNSLYSNVVTLGVAAAPLPNYLYVGIIGKTNRVGDLALVQDKNNKSIVSVQRGDLLSNRFRVTSISEKELVLMDATLKIQHKLAISEGDKSLGSPLARPTPRVDAEDDEP
ncbi:MAG TPA: IPT/TIG domain-containing protein [Pyrinomonadaceae bacterium]|nr:IPT/TIG domain-containing protein [Pyrinomonadaceae bacterium]